MLRFWWVAPLLLAVAAAVGILAGPGLRQQAAGGAVSQACAPQPCAAPHGFEADVTALTGSGSHLELTVSFHNHTAADPGGVTYNHTSPADFQLRLHDGRQVGAQFGAGCPDWGELRLARGASAGPEKLCFAASPRSAMSLVWSPDLGLLFDDVTIPVG